MSGMGGYSGTINQLISQMPQNLQGQPPPAGGGGGAGGPAPGQAGAPESGPTVGTIPGGTSGYRPPSGQMFGPGGNYFAPGTFGRGGGFGGQGYPSANYQDPVRQFGRAGQVGMPEYGYGAPHFAGPYNLQAMQLGHGGNAPGVGYGTMQPRFGIAQPHVAANPFFAGLGGGGPRYGQGGGFFGMGRTPFGGGGALGGPSGQNYFGGGFRPSGGAMGYGGPTNAMTRAYGNPDVRRQAMFGNRGPALQMAPPPQVGYAPSLGQQAAGGMGLFTNPMTGMRYGM